MERTLPSGHIRCNMCRCRRWDSIHPMGVLKWLEEKGYVHEAQVTQKGEIALRGGILDIYPLSSPWPVRMEFFGDELESLRYFDPLTQISREEVTAVTIPPGGELGILKKMRSADRSSSDYDAASPSLSGQRSEVRSQKSEISGLGTLLDYLPSQMVLVLCEPEQL